MSASNPTKDEIARALAERTNELDHLKKAHQEQARQSVRVEHELADTKKKLRDAGDQIVQLAQSQTDLLAERNDLKDALAELKSAKPSHSPSHPHLLVTGLDTRVDAMFCLGMHGDWHVSRETQSLVIGHGIPRVHVPIAQVAAWQLVPAPPTCAWEETAARWSPELLDDDEDPSPTSPEVTRAEDGEFIVVATMACSCGEEMVVTWRGHHAHAVCGNCETVWDGVYEA